jgi:lysine-N-methylase
MSKPVRHLPVVQNWDCHGCGNCCREYDVPVTEAERQRIEAQGWKQDPEIGDLPLFVRKNRWSQEYTLLRTDRGCVFLSGDNRCRLHQRHGPDAKPLACRLFPFVLVPAGDHWRVGLRFACPSVATNQGRSLTDHGAEVGSLASLLEQDEKLQGHPQPPPLLQPGQTIGWTDLLRFVHALMLVLRQPGQRLERRWRKCLALGALCRQARFDNVNGDRLAEFLQILSTGLDAEVPAEAAQVARPGWIGRLYFRQVLAILARRTRGDLRGPVTDSRWGRLLTGWRFARGNGAVPRINALLPETTFEAVEAAAPLPPSAEAILERYYVVKLGSMQFFGATCFELPFWDGLEGLAATLPPALWLARAFGLAGYAPEESVVLALQFVDDHFGYDGALDSRRYRSLVRTLARRGELASLIAWYGR